MEKPKEYYAFISYKREDERWAKWLQHKLEHYKLPSNLNGRTDLPRQIRPVFRDTSELNPGNLPQQIRDALEASKYLIVVCSPRAAKSKWVNKEIETFITMGKKDFIIPFIIEGTAHAADPTEECFPSAILHLPADQELLGANVGEMGRDAAVVKTVAQMFGVRFDTLWRRFEREQKRKRAVIIAVVALFFLAVLGVAAWIWRQNAIISKSRAELQTAYDNLTAANEATEQEKNRAVQAEKNLSVAKDSLQMAYDNISQQNTLISQQKSDLQVANDGFRTNLSRVLAEKASALVDEGDSYLARLLALQALPPNLPYTVEAEVALRKANQNEDAILYAGIEPLKSFVISPNGHSLAAFSMNDIYLWDLHTGTLLHHLTDKDASDGITSINFSPNSKQIVLTFLSGSLLIWDIHDNIIRLLEGVKSQVWNATFSPDGKRIVSASNDKKIRIWDVQTDSLLLTLDTSLVKYVTCSSDGRRFFSAGNSGPVYIWDLETGSLIGKSQDYYGLYDVSFSPNGRYILLRLGVWSYFVILDASTGKELHKFKGHTDEITSVSFSLNSQYVVSASKDKTIRLWDVEKRQQIGQLQTGHTSVVNSTRFSPDGKQIVSALNDSTIKIWDVETKQVTKSIRLPYSAFKVTFTHDGKHIIFKSGNNIHLLDTSTTQCVDSIGGDCNRDAVYNSNGQCLISSSSSGLTRLWDVATKTQIGLSFNGPVRLAPTSISPNGRYIISRYNYKTIIIRDVRSGSQIGQPLKGHTEYINSAVFSPDGKYIVSASNDQTIRIWDVETGQQVRPPLKRHTSVVVCAAFSPDGKYIVSASKDKTVRIWDAKTGQQVGSPLEGHTSDVNSASFSPDGKTIVSASSDKTVRIWDAKTGQCIRLIEGHFGDVWTASFSADGNKIVSASADKTMRVWDSKSGKCLQLFKGPASMFSAAFSPDGKHIVSGSADGFIRIWAFPPLQELIDSTTERFKTRQLTPEERRKYYLE